MTDKLAKSTYADLVKLYHSSLKKIEGLEWRIESKDREIRMLKDKIKVTLLQNLTTP
tara:strand:+ start:444 stop:614 length:171 start_codon:yes stop_codon:yes gene_type:complete